MKTYKSPLHTSTLACAFAGGSRYLLGSQTYVERPSVIPAGLVLYSIGANGTLSTPPAVGDIRTVLENKALTDLEAGKSLSDHRVDQAIRAMERKAAAAPEPLHFILRGIVALSENIIDEQDRSRVFDPVAVGEVGRAIRQTANSAMTQAIQLHESHAALVAALEKITRRVPIMASTGDYREGQLHALEECSEIARAALHSAK